MPVIVRKIISSSDNWEEKIMLDEQSKLINPESNAAYRFSEKSNPLNCEKHAKGAFALGSTVPSGR